MAKHEPPKDGLVRASRPGLEIRAAEGEGNMPTLHGYFIRFNEPTEIDSLFEGRFIERIAPGAAKKTLEENRDAVKILFNHGHDPSIGEKPLAKPELKEDDTGVHYEGELFDTSYNRDLVPALESGQLGASFKFRSVKESFDEEPDPSDDNPEGLPERTIEELKLYEGGPVVFPAYEGATAGVRSMTDHLFVERARKEPARVPELVELYEEWVAQNPERAQEILANATSAAEERKPEVEDTTDTRAEASHSEPEAPGAGQDHSVATTKQESEDTDWWRSLSDDNNKEWQLP